MNKKGITPLIATVILIGFVVAIATITSTFFTSFTKEQTEGIGDSGDSVSQCGMGSLDMEANSTYEHPQGNISVNIINTGKTELAGLKMVIRDETGSVNTYDVDKESISVSEIKTIETIENVTEDINGGIQNISKITVTTSCPGIYATLENNSGSWNRVY